MILADSCGCFGFCKYVCLYLFLGIILHSAVSMTTLLACKENMRGARDISWSNKHVDLFLLKPAK